MSTETTEPDIRAEATALLRDLAEVAGNTDAVIATALSRGSRATEVAAAALLVAFAEHIEPTEPGATSAFEL